MAVKEYANLIPTETRKAIKSLGNDVRIAAVTALIEHRELSLSELQEKLEIERPNLIPHLKNLVKSSIVEQCYRHEVGNPKYSFYSVTGFGEDLIRALVSSLVPLPSSASKDAKFEIEVAGEPFTTPFIPDLSVDQEKIPIIVTPSTA